jgi:antitoxin component YwqK of YwqJK toxin-antitoxin module
MEIKIGSRILNVPLAAIVVIVIVLVVMTNWWLGKDKKPLSKETRIQEEPAVEVLQPVLEGEVSRQTWLDPNREYEESVFYIQEHEIARFKNSGNKIFDFTGQIPDGPVKFKNQTDKTYGEEKYVNNKRNGAYNEYFMENGKIKKEAYYLDGELKTMKEYFPDGVLRMQMNYEDALFGVISIEVGAGKVYTRTGSLKYEWSLTNRGRGGFNRSYNIAGEMVAENHFDEFGTIVKAWKKPPQIEAEGPAAP